MSRVLLIGVDGMDFDFVRANLDHLPNMRQLSESGSLDVLPSVFPPDSIPAWVTIYTGLSPSEHGIVDTIDYLKKDYKSFAIDTSAFKDKTFWDNAGRAGKRVVVVNPFLAYPVWPVNGVMVSGPVFLTGENQAYPESTMEQYPDCPPLGGIADFPEKGRFHDFVANSGKETARVADYGYKLLTGEDWDLFFISFFTLDRIQHFLWRYCDEEDPTFPGANHLQGAILDHYRQFDEIIGRYAATLGPSDRLVVISDHGHGMRCTKTLNLNEYLRRKGYLKTDANRFPFLSRKFWVETAKNLVIASLYSIGKEDWLYKITKFVPNRQKLKTGAHVIDKGDSVASVPKFDGTGPFGGIDVNAPDPERYEEIRAAILTDLEELDRRHKGKLFRWFDRRERIQGDTSQYEYPDIIFELEPEYGVNWSLFVPLIARNYFHRRLSGGHRPGGVLLTNGELSYRPDSVADVSDMVLTLLEDD